MTDKIDDGGPAFAHGDPTHGGDPGASLRDYFAGQALIGICSAPFTEDAAPEMARVSYVLADAMIAARKVQP